MVFGEVVSRLRAVRLRTLRRRRPSRSAVADPRVDCDEALVTREAKSSRSAFLGASDRPGVAAKAEANWARWERESELRKAVCVRVVERMRQRTASGTNFLQNGYFLHTPTSPWHKVRYQAGFIPLLLSRL